MEASSRIRRRASATCYKSRVLCSHSNRWLTKTDYQIVGLLRYFPSTSMRFLFFFFPRCQGQISPWVDDEKQIQSVGCSKGEAMPGVTEGQAPVQYGSLAYALLFYRASSESLFLLHHQPQIFIDATFTSSSPHPVCIAQAVFLVPRSQLGWHLPSSAGRTLIPIIKVDLYLGVNTCLLSGTGRTTQLLAASAKAQTHALMEYHADFKTLGRRPCTCKACEV